MRVAVVGGGPGGLCAAIGLGQLGHDVVVLERLEHPSARPSRSRQRSYPVDISGGGMAALEALGAAPEGGALRRRLLPFLGHAAEPGGRAPRPMRSPGLIGTREDVVRGLEEHIEERGGRWAGRVRVFHGVEVGRLDLAARTVEVVGAVGCDLGEAAAAAQQPFDLICACDGKFSRLRAAAAEQDPGLRVTEGQRRRFGENIYKTLNLDRSEAVERLLVPGYLYACGGCVVTRLPAGDAVGIVSMWRDADWEPGLVRRRLGKLLPCVSAEEEAAFDMREVQDAGGGFTVSRLHAGGCLVLLGDSATTPPPPGQGCGHAICAAAALVSEFKKVPLDCTAETRGEPAQACGGKCGSAVRTLSGFARADCPPPSPSPHTPHTLFHWRIGSGWRVAYAEGEQGSRRC
ncbi:unnamed protein product [Prorocentrum cordatum]|uniref:FAD-binding domain-containing protein n=1 Tax=Prorocentrum cordatum TaxID=2364126 RepID=A0ABN9SXW1_9DINO|nr:unnamed protein product [Polarella glacialis]